MRITSNIAVRTLLWLAALALPVQSVAGASCRCDGVNSKSHCSGSEETRSCCCSTTLAPEGGSCCVARPEISAGSCCETESACSCGGSCQCETLQPLAPLTPPTEDNTAEQLTRASVSLSFVWAASPLPMARNHSRWSSTFEALGATDRCVSLCRFTL